MTISAGMELQLVNSPIINRSSEENYSSFCPELSSIFSIDNCRDSSYLTITEKLGDKKMLLYVVNKEIKTQAPQIVRLLTNYILV